MSNKKHHFELLAQLEHDVSVSMLIQYLRIRKLIDDLNNDLVVKHRDGVRGSGVCFGKYV